MQTRSLKKIQVAQPLADFINKELLPDLKLDEQKFWQDFEQIITRFSAQNKRLLKRRDELQQQIDDWHREHEYDEKKLTVYQQFLQSIGYLQTEGEDFTIEVDNVDAEISSIAGPQLVVPINNARFAINAANARWGSLYDALYGSDMIEQTDDAASSAEFNQQRALKVFDFCHDWLDEVLPLQRGAHALCIAYRLHDDKGHQELQIELSDHSITHFQLPEQFCGWTNNKGTLVLLFSHHRLHFELHIDADSKIGALHPAAVSDVVVEAAISTIQDCEDSVSAVDVEDKLQVYRNWLGLIDGTLSVEMTKESQRFTRRLNEDRSYFDVNGQAFSLPGRSLLLIRNTGLHMNTDLVLDQNGERQPEGLVDALVSALISMRDLQPQRTFKNSRSGSIYIVKPKLHGPEEVAFSVALFDAIEQAYGLAQNTIKIGVMDEERRTSVNLQQCIRAARQRIVFINTGFLDRTGDEIHTSMQSGAMLPKDDIKKARWINAYENNNVDVALRCGFSGVAQIGKGMWAEPDNLQAMYHSKRAHPEAGANCAWVPSPTAAVIHALHYHQMDVFERQQALRQRITNTDDLLRIPLLPPSLKLDELRISQELENNAQSILGYVVKWIELGIGCSKVPDIHDTGLMEDRATLRISSQLLANWLMHGLISEQQLLKAFKRMAQVVDRQNQATAGYQPMAPGFDGLAFQAALELVMRGNEFPNGYTEDCLLRYRLAQKAQHSQR